MELNLIAEEDHEFIRALVNSKGWLDFIGDRNVHSKEDSIEYIRKIQKTEGIIYWVARLKDSNTPIGMVSFIKRTYLDHFDIGFAFLPEYFGYGYAYEAAKEVLSIVSKSPEHQVILATTVPENAHSIKLLGKLGLHFEREIEVEKTTLHVYST